MKDLLNKIHQGDCLDIMRQLPDKCVDLVLTDPPYNISKDIWDTWIKQENYIAWMGTVFIEIQRILKPNGSFYFFHNDFLQVVELQNYINQNTSFVFKQLIIWNKRYTLSKNKGFFDGYIAVDDLRNYQKLAEYCLFYTFQDDSGLTKEGGNLVYLMRDYIRSEIIRAKGSFTFKEVNKALGTATNGGGVASACLSEDKTVPAVMTREHYIKLRDWLNGDYLQKPYEDIRKEYDELRYYFANQKKHHSVWEYEIAEKESAHMTPKPIPMIENILLHSSKENALVLDCFSGTGTTAIACDNLNRQFICVEKDADYHKASVARLNKHRRQGNLFLPTKEQYEEAVQQDFMNFLGNKNPDH